MVISIPKIALEDVYISVLTEKRVTNAEGWTRKEPVSHDLRPSGSVIVDAVVLLLHHNRFRDPKTAVERLAVNGRELSTALHLPDGLYPPVVHRTLSFDGGAGIFGLYRAGNERDCPPLWLHRSHRREDVSQDVQVAHGHVRAVLPPPASPPQLPGLIQLGLNLLSSETEPSVRNRTPYPSALD